MEDVLWVQYPLTALVGIQAGYYNRGADGDSAATGTKSPSRRTWVWKISATLACPSRIRE